MTLSWTVICSDFMRALLWQIAGSNLRRPSRRWFENPLPGYCLIVRVVTPPPTNSFIFERNPSLSSQSTVSFILSKALVINTERPTNSGLVSLNGDDQVSGINVHAQVEDLKAVRFEKLCQDILSQVVDYPLSLWPELCGPWPLPAAPFPAPARGHPWLL